MTPTTFELAKKRQGFVHAQQRPSCSSCQHASRMVHNNTGNVGLQCMKGGFYTTAMSMCDRHARLDAAPV